MKLQKLAIILLTVSGGALHASDGTAPEEVTLNVKSKLPFVDRTQFVDNGIIEYSVPKQLNDGIKVADARKIADLSGVLTLLNATEKKNQDFRMGIGEPHKLAGKNDRDPRIKGCIDSVLIAKDGKLILEEYFADARIDKPHYQMSTTKSILSHAIGKAIERGEIHSENDLLLDYLPEVDRKKVSKGVEKLRLSDLLSMSSGIRFKKKPSGRDITIENHAELYLTQCDPINEVRDYKYDGTNCDLLSHVLYNATGKTLTEYAGEHIFKPMGITDFAFGDSVCGLNKSAAGMQLRSRDMLKIGLMTANGGVWNGKRILSEEWINKATAVHVNHHQPSKYGYFWWSQDATVNGKTYRVRSCRGAGGQFIFVLPELDVVAVFTSYYSDNRPLQHFEKVVLPMFL